MQPSAINIESGRRGAGWVAILLSAVGFGLGPLLAGRAFASGVDPVLAGLGRMALPAIALAPFSLRSALRWRRTSAHAAAGGGLAALGFTLFLTAVEADPLVATAVYYTYPLAVMVGGALRGIRPSHMDLARSAAIVIGVVMCLGPGELSAESWRAAVLALGAPVSWAVLLTMLSGRLAPMPASTRLFASTTGGALAVLPLVMLERPPMPGPEALQSLGILVLCSGAIPLILVTWGAPFVGARSTALAGTLEFPVALTLLWAVSETAVVRDQVIGAVLIVGAALAVRERGGRDL